MFKPVMEIVAAALVASLVVFVTAGAPTAGNADATASTDRPAVAVKGSACSLQAWPHFERSCQFDRRKAGNEPRPVRVLALR